METLRGHNLLSLDDLTREGIVEVTLDDSGRRDHR